jgi:Flp pilus assembly protein TadG
MNRPSDTEQTVPDGGYATAFVTVIALALMAVIGLAVDGGGAAAAHARAQAAAAESARAGADELDLQYFRQTGITRLNPAEAGAAAAAWLSRTGFTGSVSASATEVTVTATDDAPTQILGIVGVGSITVTATSTATPRSPEDVLGLTATATDGSTP